MKKTRILSGALGLFVILAMLCTGVIGVSASDITVTTSTAYNVDNPSFVTITSKITGVEKDEQVTYLAYNDDERGPYADGKDTNIIFVEQLESQSGDGGYYGEFTYITEASKINSTIVRFGAQTTNVSGADGNDTTPKIFAHNVTVTPANGGEVYLSVKNTEGKWESLENTPEKIVQGDVAIKLVPDEDKKVNSLTVTVNGDEKTVQLIDDECVIENVDGALVITATFADKDPVIEPTITDAVSFGGSGGTDLDGPDKIAVAFSQISVPSGIEEYEHGILLYFDSKYNDSESINFGSTIVPDENTTVSRSNDNIYKFQAFAKTPDGKFAVKLIDNRGDDVNVLKGGNFYLRPYLKYGSKVIFGAAQKY